MRQLLSLHRSAALHIPQVIGIAADHGGYKLKKYLTKMLREVGAVVVSFGDSRLNPDDDYPDFVVPLARAVASGEVQRGIAICGSGVGVSVCANKVPGVRACLIHDLFSAHQGVEDDDLNIICLGGSVVGNPLAWDLVRIFLSAEFSGKRRHRRRLEKVRRLEVQLSPKPIRLPHKALEVVIQADATQKESPSGQITSLKLYLIRHGQTEWSLSGQYTGSTDLPLTSAGKAAARKVGKRLKGISFSNVFVSPLKRAQKTCALASLKPSAVVEPMLTEWDNGDYEGHTPAEIRNVQPGWNLFVDGAPNGETPAEISERVDRLIAHLRTLEGNVALFSHGHLCRVLAARWIGDTVEQAEHLLLYTASVSILSYAHGRLEVPAIELWNSEGNGLYNAVPRSEDDAAKEKKV